jgi:hypothetical protein
VSVTVPTTEVVSLAAWAVTDAVFNDAVVMTAARIVSDCVCAVPVGATAEMVMARSLDRGVVLIVNVAELWPAAMVNDPATVANVDELVRVIGNPPAGAGPLSVTVPDAGDPPITEGTLNANALTVGATLSWMSSVALLGTPAPKLELDPSVRMTVSAFS